MARTILLFVVFAVQFGNVEQASACLHCGHAKACPTFSGFTGKAFFQTDRPLTLNQIEQLLDSKIEDPIIAREIRKLGIAFRVDAVLLDGLLKRGVGAQTRQALEQHEERAATAELFNEKNAARRLTLSKEFLQRFPRSSESARVAAEIRKAELEIFEESFRTFSDAPSAAGLEQVLTLGRDLLRRQPDRPTVVQVASKLALATGRGMIGNFYSDLEQSRAFANRALELLESPAPPPGLDQQTYNQLRTNNLSLIYQSLGLYLLRQPTPDAEQAISFLTKAAELKGGPSASDPITYWLRALARDMTYQQLNADYSALPKTQRTGRQGQSLCARIETLFNQLFADYTQVLTLSGRTASSQLNEQAVEALRLLATGERHCQGGRGGLVDEWPGEEKRAALVIGVEDHLDKQVGKFNYAASDARAVAAALVRNGGFRRENVTLLATGEAAERQPLRSVILQQLAELPNRVKKDGQDGLLLIYFAGPEFERNGKSYLLAADSLTGSEALLADTAISVERLKEMIRAGGAAQVVLIFESFRRAPVSESLARLLTFDVRKNDVTAFASLLAAGVGERAYESPSKKQGVFTSVFLEAIRGKAANKARGVTLEDLTKYLRTAVPREAQRESAANTAQTPAVTVEGYEAEDLAMFSPDEGGRGAEPAELARNAQTIHVRSKTIYLNPAQLEAELRKLPEFQALKLRIVSEAKDADLVAEITLPFLTWMWTFTVTPRESNAPLFADKLRELTVNTAAPRLAKEIVTRLQTLRDSPRR